MDKLVTELTQKDENVALKAARSIVATSNFAAFEKLCAKSEFLFDFVKNNVCNRFKKVINETNYRNVFAFFDVYDENYVDCLVEAVAKYASEELSDEMYDLLENGNNSQKKYAAKYFSFIPDTIALEQLEKYAFDEDIELAVNSAEALGRMGDSSFYEHVLTKLSTDDEFELIKVVRFLVAYGDKRAVDSLLKALENSSTAENIAGEIPYLMSMSEMLQTKELDSVLSCFDSILLGVGEVLSLSEVFSYEIYDILQSLIAQARNTPNSHVAQVLLRALDKFSTFMENDEYVFDESKDVKNEIKEIYQLLEMQTSEFWSKQRKLIGGELVSTKYRVISALEVIRALNIIEAESALLKLVEATVDEQILVSAVGIAKSLGIQAQLDKDLAISKAKGETSKALLISYLI